MPLINCKVELKYTWTKYCWQLVLIILIILILIILFNSNIIIFNIKDTKLHIPVVTLSARDNKKLSKLLSKRFERSDRNKYKTKSENKNTTNEYRYFFESNFVGVNRLFVLVYTNHDDNAKRFNAQKYYLSKGIIKNYNIIINGKNFYDQAIDSDIKRYEEIRKLTTEQSEITLLDVYKKKLYGPFLWMGFNCLKA